MRQEVRLFIGGLEVDFSEPPQILFTYTQNDLTNPSVVKNSYTKTLTIEGTPANNNIFGHFWDLSRVQSYGTDNLVETGFDAARKTDFVLFYNGEIYESGYVKLDKVTKKSKTVQYEVTLYGGIGGFFYDLTYDADGNKLKLSDLVYTEGGGDDEFDFIVRKETIAEAWDSIHDNYSKWKAINFAPCYEGNPDNFDTDKCVVNFKDAAVLSAVTSGGTTYTAKNGYSLGSFPDKLDMWATRDIRSYLVRPVLNISAFFDGIKRLAEVKGYELDLDPDFFNNQNPYYIDSWLTLPLLSEMKLTGADLASQTQVTPSVSHTATYNGYYNTEYTMAFSPDLPLGTGTIDLNMEFNVSGKTAISQDMYSSAYIGSEKNFSAYAVQLCAFDGSTTYNSNVVAASTAVFLTSKVGNEYLTPDNTAWKPKGNGDYQYSFGKWTHTGSGTWKWSEPLNFRLELPKNYGCIGLVITSVANLETVETYNGGTAVSYGTRRAQAYTSQYLTSGTSSNMQMLYHYKQIIFNGATVNAYNTSESAGYSGAHLSKKTLLNMDNTPCDYFLGYCKMFNLYFLKQPHEKKIKVLMRGNFYNTGITENVNELIDRGSEIKITPVAYESMWYNLGLDQVQGSFSEQYENTYGTKYGTQRINTGYEFDVEEKKILENNVYKSAVEGTEKSRYYLAPLSFAPSNQMPAYVVQGFKYLLYSGDSTYEVDMGYKNYEFEPLNKDLYYDQFPKPQFRDADYKGKDGKNVLLFFTGYDYSVNVSGRTIPYWITDDIGAMGKLNEGTPCWIYTEGEYDTSNNKIAIQYNAIPMFQRNVAGWSGNIIRSWDFGAPRQLFTNNYYWTEQAGIYAQFWQNYLRDFYSTDTRVVDCKMLIEQRPNPEMLHKFYWFDNSVWRLNKIDEWNVSSFDLTTVQFVKIQDLANYTSTPVSETEVNISVRLSKYTANKTGDTITAYIHVSDGGSWYVDDYDEGLTISPLTGFGEDSTCTITVAANNTGNERTLNIYFMADNSYALVGITQGYPTLSVNRFAGSGNIAAAGGTALFTVYTDSDQDWSATTPYTGYVTLTPTGGTGTGTVEMTFSRNTDNSERTAYFNVSAGTLTTRSETIHQNAAGDPRADFNPTTLSVPGKQGTYTVQVTSNVNWQLYYWADWVSTTPANLSVISAGTSTITISVTRNPSAINSRITTILAKNENGTYTLEGNSSLLIEQEDYNIGN